MPRQNRVTPDGELIAVPDRGLFWGNRGSLHDASGRLVRYSRGRTWAICVLSFKGRQRELWAPGRLTELFFLDEATGLAAGHRPCGECRYRDYQAFKRSWALAFGGGVPGVAEIDARMHTDRLVRPGVRRLYTAALSSLPDGVMVSVDGAPYLVRGGDLLAWTPGGYRPAAGLAAGGLAAGVLAAGVLAAGGLAAGPTVTVITPRATVAVLAAGYRPVIHPSADV